MSIPRVRRVLAVASGGGHWIQLSRLLPAFDECDVAFLTTLKSYRAQVDGARFYVVQDALYLRDFARSRLAPFKVPKAIEEVGELPRNAAGKILRRELAQDPLRPVQVLLAEPQDDEAVRS